jgi:hypothetical protein
VANRKQAAKQARLDDRAQAILRQQEAERRTRNIVIAAFVVLILGGFGLLYSLTTQWWVKPPPPPAAAYSVADEGQGHVPTCIASYKHRPPSSGCHNSTATAPRPWQAFSTEVPAADYVHNLEHGGIVVLYKCTGTAECSTLFNEAKALYSTLPPEKFNEVKLVTSPYTDMDPKVAVLAWDKELDLTNIDSNAILGFYNTYVDHGREDVK